MITCYNISESDRCQRKKTKINTIQIIPVLLCIKSELPFHNYVDRLFLKKLYNCATRLTSKTMKIAEGMK